MFLCLKKYLRRRRRLFFLSLWQHLVGLFSTPLLLFPFSSFFFLGGGGGGGAKQSDGWDKL